MDEEYKCDVHQVSWGGELLVLRLFHLWLLDFVLFLRLYHIDP